MSLEQDIKDAVLGNVSKLVELSKSNNNFVRKIIAENKNTPIEVLKKLTKDSSSHVRQAVAKNKKIPPDILNKMIEDADIGVKISVIRNDNLDIDFMLKFVNYLIKRGYKDAPVLDKLLEREYVPKSVLMKLVKNKKYRDKAARHKSADEEVKEIVKMDKLLEEYIG